MSSTLIQLKRTTFSFLIASLGLASIAGARSLQDHSDHDHGSHKAETKVAAKMEFAGDPYMLGVDGVSGKKLGAIDSQVIIKHEGRELRFASEKTASMFKAAPAKYLPGIDKKMIEQQVPFYPMTTCLISGEKLGGEMGDIVDVIYRNRLVRLCCKGCKRSLAKDPAKLIAKIDQAVIKAQGAHYALDTCPISGGKLGEMGEPINLVMGNRLVRLCCKGCVKKAGKDPLAMIAKLDAASKGGHGKAEKSHGDGHDH